MCRYAICLILFLISGTFSSHAEDTPLPRLEVKELPEPPQQNTPWLPPSSNLPSNAVSAAQFLFTAGMADPRGCEYREFKTVVGSVWGYEKIFQAHGWVIPAQSQAKSRFVIGWNGLVYPAVEIGEQKDLRQDIESLLQNNIKDSSRLSFQQLPEEASLSETNRTVIKALILLRLGEVTLAQKYWSSIDLKSLSYPPKEVDRDPFLLLAYYWAWSMFDRAICAHMRGDDSLALIDSLRLAALWPKLEKEATLRGFSRPKSITNVEQGYFEFLSPVKELSGDQVRRAKEAISAQTIPIQPPNNQADRITVLIKDLSEIKTRQWGQPGGISWNSDPRIKTLVAEGEAAVEPLLDCLENDQRLTRSVSFHRDFFPQRNILPVKSAAHAALAEILKINLENAPAYRAYWQKYRSISKSERFLHLLEDDQAGAGQWLEAARNILSRTDGKQVFLWGNAPRPKATNSLAYHELSLRENSHSAVSSALLKRALELAPVDYRSTKDYWTFNDAVTFGLMLAEWDPTAARLGLIKIIQRSHALFDQPNATGRNLSGRQFALLVRAMAELGDDQGLAHYASWVAKQSYSDLVGDLPYVLSPLGKFPENPKIKTASVVLFQKETEKWIFGQSWHNDLLSSSLMYNESFRSLVLEAMNDKTPSGSIMLNENGNFTIQIRTMTEIRSLEKDASTPKVGEKITLRRCDEIAYRLSHLENLPDFQIYWPENMRDKALIETAKFLREHGSDFKLKPSTLLRDDDR